MLTAATGDPAASLRHIGCRASGPRLFWQAPKETEMNQQQGGNQQGGPRSQQQRLRELQEEKQQQATLGENKERAIIGNTQDTPSVADDPQGRSGERQQGGMPRNVIDDEERP
jgi:hypothetical protein